MKELIKIVGLLIGFLLICHVFFEYIINRKVPEWLVLISLIVVALIYTFVVLQVVKQIKKLLKL